MDLPLFHVDAFASRVFTGNPAAVVPLRAWLDDATLLKIAAENLLSETAFFVPNGKDADFDLRWMSPVMEIDLCGHATLATAFVLFNYLEPKRTRATFKTQSGVLSVERAGEKLAMTLPARPGAPERVDDKWYNLLGARTVQLEQYRSRDVMVVFETADDVAALKPMYELLRDEPEFGVIATAPGKDCDFVSRYFAPKEGILEDPVTGSAHCTLAPYWATRLGKTTLTARQLSPRGGELTCEMTSAGVRIVGQAVLYLSGSIRVP